MVIRSKIGQRFGGLFILLIGAGYTAWLWYKLHTEGYYHEYAAAVFPVFAVLGLGLILFPMDLDEIKAKYGVEKPESFQQMPLPWKILFFVALAAGIGNWIAMANM